MRMFADFDAIRVGDREELVKSISEQDIQRFVEMTGDDNSLHVDPQFASETSFKDVVAYGMLGASFISTVIGTKLPGPGALWIPQNLEFLLPVRLGDRLTVACTVLKKNDRERLLELEKRIVNQNQQTVLSGQGKVKVLVVAAPRPAAAGGNRHRRHWWDWRGHLPQRRCSLGSLLPNLVLRPRQLKHRAARQNRILSPLGLFLWARKYTPLLMAWSPI